MISHIYLEKDQIELLKELVEASRRVDSSKRQAFLFTEDESGYDISHPGLRTRLLKTYIGDINALKSQGLISIQKSDRYMILFDVDPKGFEYYDKLIITKTNPIDRMQEQVKRYINNKYFLTKYKIAYQKWEQAEALLWSNESNKKLTIIGHTIREAIQEFMDELLNNFNISATNLKKQDTIQKYRLIKNKYSENFSKSEDAFIEALLNYFGTTIDLVQRQEHDSQKENNILVWDDARRIVFHALLIMMEIDNIFIRISKL